MQSTEGYVASDAAVPFPVERMQLHLAIRGLPPATLRARPADTTLALPEIQCIIAVPSEEGELWGTSRDREQLLAATRAANFQWDRQLEVWIPLVVVEPPALYELGKVRDGDPISTRNPDLSFAGHFEWNRGFLHYLLQGAATHSRGQKSFLTYCWRRCVLHGVYPRLQPVPQLSSESEEIPSRDVLTLHALFSDDATFRRVAHVQRKWELHHSWFKPLQRGPGKSMRQGVLFFDSHELLSRHFDLLHHYYAVKVVPAGSVTVRLPRTQAMEMKAAGTFARAWQEGWWWEAESEGEGKEAVIKLPDSDAQREVWTYT